MPVAPTKKITTKQQKLLDAYLSNGGYLKKAADEVKMSLSYATQVIKFPLIAEQIEISLKEGAEKALITSDRLLEEEKRLSEVNPKDLYDQQGNLITNIKDLPEDTARAISSVKFRALVTGRGDGQLEWKIMEVKFWDKGRSLERLEKIKGMFEADNAQRAPILQPALTEEDREILLKLSSGLVNDILEEHQNAITAGS